MSYHWSFDGALALASQTLIMSSKWCRYCAMSRFNDRRGWGHYRVFSVNRDQCSPGENPSLARSTAWQWGPRAARPLRCMRTAPKTQPLALPSPPSRSFSPLPPLALLNLFKQIKSTLLFHRTFIWRATPPLSLCFFRSPCVSRSLRRTARVIFALHPPRRTKQSQSSL